MNRSRTFAAVAALAVSATAIAGAQIGGKPVSGGDPTPGTEQPAPPSLADRITLAGWLRAAPKTAGATRAPDSNTPSDARFVLANATRVDRVPADIGGSPPASAASDPTYRLEGIESQFSPFVDTKVEISGEIRPRASGDSPAANSAPTLIVEFVQKIAITCP